MRPTAAVHTQLLQHSRCSKMAGLLSCKHSSAWRTWGDAQGVQAALARRKGLLDCPVLCVDGAQLAVRGHTAHAATRRRSRHRTHGPACAAHQRRPWPGSDAQVLWLHQAGLCLTELSTWPLHGALSSGSPLMAVCSRPAHVACGGVHGLHAAVSAAQHQALPTPRTRRGLRTGHCFSLSSPHPAALLAESAASRAASNDRVAAAVERARTCGSQHRQVAADAAAPPPPGSSLLAWAVLLSLTAPAAARRRHCIQGPTPIDTALLRPLHRAEIARSAVRLLAAGAHLCRRSCTSHRRTAGRPGPDRARSRPASPAAARQPPYRPESPTLRTALRAKRARQRAAAAALPSCKSQEALLIEDRLAQGSSAPREPPQSFSFAHAGFWAGRPRV